MILLTRFVEYVKPTSIIMGTICHSHDIVRELVRQTAYILSDASSAVHSPSKLHGISLGLYPTQPSGKNPGKSPHAADLVKFLHVPSS